MNRWEAVDRGAEEAAHALRDAERAVWTTIARDGTATELVRLAGCGLVRPKRDAIEWALLRRQPETRAIELAKIDHRLLDRVSSLCQIESSGYLEARRLRNALVATQLRIARWAARRFTRTCQWISDDLAQESSIGALIAVHHWSHGDRAMALPYVVVTITRRYLRDVVIRARRYASRINHEHSTDDALSPHAHVTAAVAGRELRACIASILPELGGVQQDILRRRFWLDQSKREIAAALDMNVKTVHRSIGGALRKIVTRSGQALAELAESSLPDHGTPAMYNGGCRCPRCVSGALRRSSTSCGTASRYTLGCRCEQCATAMRAKDRRLGGRGPERWRK